MDEFLLCFNFGKYYGYDLGFVVLNVRSLCIESGFYVYYFDWDYYKIVSDKK